jgi:hypothetical protein
MKTATKETRVQNAVNMKNATADSNTATLNACNGHFVRLLKNVKSVL